MHGQVTLADQRGEAGFFRSHPRPAERFAYLQQLLQQEAHLPSEHFWQELQLVLQHFAQALSAAEAVASPRPAMMTSIAPALMNVFILFLFVCCCSGEGVIPAPSFHEVITRRAPDPPENLRSAE